MMLNFEELAEKHRLDVTGIIQAGAHLGEELPSFKRVGTKRALLFEPLEFLQVNLHNVCKQFTDMDIIIHKKALANFIGEREMFVESQNQGQSSSLLEPQEHLRKYPEIKFEQRWTVFCDMLDNIDFDRKKYKGLMADIQGAELLMLMGAEKTLNNIDWFYTEVNTEYLYRGNVLLHELDDFLNKKGFERVETSRIQNGWGDALYIKSNENHHVSTKVSTDEHPDKNNYVDVPTKFKPSPSLIYPKDNKLQFEVWFDRQYLFSKRSYLPVYFTAYHVNNNYGNNPKSLKELQKFIDLLDRSKKYFTIVQYDDGTLVDWKDLDIIIFQMSTVNELGVNVQLIPIPMVCWEEGRNWEVQERDIYCSFVGRENTHQIRRWMRRRFQNNNSARFHMHFSNWDKISYDKFLARSKFALAPRGYSNNSFRICEAMRFGAIPVYISNRFHLPFNMPFDYGVLCHVSHKNDEFPALIEKLKAANEKIEELRLKVKDTYDKYFTYKGLFSEILKRV